MKYVALVSYGHWAGFATASGWRELPLDCKGDIDLVLEFEGPEYVTEGLTDREVDLLFYELQTRSKNVVGEHSLWLAVQSVGFSIRRLNAAIVSAGKRRLKSIKDLALHLRPKPNQ